MADLTLKNVPEDLRAQLQREAEANFRSLEQEAQARLAQSFEIAAALNTRRDQKWMDEAIASGEVTPLTRAEMDKVRDRALGRRA